MQYRILAINPGSTSTKAALYEGEKTVRHITVRHGADQLAAFPDIASQLGFRKELILQELSADTRALSALDAVIGRGGLVKPIPSGVYEVNDDMAEDLRSCRYGSHASNLGGLIAREIASETGARAFIADPVVVDELEEVARITGIAGIERKSIFHALNQKAVAREYAASAGRKYEEMDLIVAHLGGGISVGAHRKGRVVDVNNALNGEGPFSPERAGTIPACSMAEMAMSGDYSEAEIQRLLAGKGGLVSLLGTNDVRETLERAGNGDSRATLVMDAMCYNIGKSIGAMAAVLGGRVDAIILTGGIAYNPQVCDRVTEMCGFIAPVVVKPGENELEALASNARAVLEGRSVARTYTRE
ncbi:MAG: butyrate kinase [Alistipes sp.]|nr:butyrate kinase [Alistipes sp.]